MLCFMNIVHNELFSTVSANCSSLTSSAVSAIEYHFQFCGHNYRRRQLRLQSHSFNHDNVQSEFLESKTKF
ncbi:hypothetical protein Plhal304r1_c025g0084061 [Plasmopara halstedii]